MKSYRSLLLLFAAVTLIGITTSCQRSNNGVQAAREERATDEGATNPGNTRLGDKNVLSPQDREIAFKIEQANVQEIDLGRYVRDKTKNSDVKDFAKMIIDDHNEALNKLQDLLKDKNVNQPSMSKPEDETAMMNTLQNASPDDLDSQYLKMMVQDHQKDLDELRSAEASVQNPDLKSYIQDFIPVVQKHLDKAQELENDMAKQESH